MNHPRPLAHKLKEELETHSFTNSIEQLAQEQAQQIGIVSTYESLLATANGLPSVLDARIRDLKSLIDYEHATNDELTELIEEQRTAKMQRLRALAAELDAAERAVETGEQQALAKWNEVAEVDARIHDLKTHNGLSKEQRSAEQALGLLNRLPVDPKAAAHLSTDEIWERMERFAAAQERPPVPIYSLFPSVEKFLASA